MERMGSRQTEIISEMDVPEIKENKVTDKLTSPRWINDKEEPLNGRFEKEPNK